MNGWMDGWMDLFFSFLCLNKIQTSALEEWTGKQFEIRTSPAAIEKVNNTTTTTTTTTTTFTTQHNTPAGGLTLGVWVNQHVDQPDQPNPPPAGGLTLARAAESWLSESLPLELSSAHQRQHQHQHHTRGGARKTDHGLPLSGAKGQGRRKRQNKTQNKKRFERTHQPKKREGKAARRNNNAQRNKNKNKSKTASTSGWRRKASLAE